MGKYLYKNLDYAMPSKRADLRSGSIGEDYENLPKKEKVRHTGTYRYKRADFKVDVLDNLMKKHVNEPYEVLYADIALLFKVGSLERLHIEREIVYLLEVVNDRIKMYPGYDIFDGIIREVKRVNGKITLIIP